MQEPKQKYNDKQWDNAVGKRKTKCFDGHPVNPGQTSEYDACSSGDKHRSEFVKIGYNITGETAVSGSVGELLLPANNRI